MDEITSKTEDNSHKSGQMPSSEVSDAPKTLVYQKLHSFSKNSPNYNREEHLALSSKGGKVRKPAKRALCRLLSRQQKKYATDICKVSAVQAMEFYKLILNLENFKSFTRTELFELLALMRSDFEDDLKWATVTNPDGSPKGIEPSLRKKLIESKTRQLELLLKVGKTFFPELRESFALNFIRSDVPLDPAQHPDLKLVTPLDVAQNSPSSAAPEKSEASLASPSGQSAPNDATSSELAAAEPEQKIKSKVIKNDNNDDNPK